MLSRRWCFTLNNYEDADVAHLRNTASLPTTSYLVFGREVGESGTPHLQGFIIFTTPKRLRGTKQAVGQRAHLEVARATSSAASDYCKKDDDYEEFGTLPFSDSPRNGFDSLKQWVLEQPLKPTAKQVAEEYPGLWIRYGRIMEWIDHIYPRPILVEGTLRPWQQELSEALEEEADDRKIIFVVDPIGGVGKSWFIKYWLSHHALKTQRLSIGKRDDLAYAIDASKSVFLFDIPRSQSEYLQYSVLEQLKDRMIFSPKYNSCSKELNANAHVVVFMNEEPDYNKLSNDRFEVIRPR